MSKRVCIVGGGISGLCTANALRRANADVTLFEKGPTAGGNIRTEQIDGFQVEHGPNSLIVTSELFELISNLGIGAQIAQAKPAAKNRFIVRGRKLLPLPSGLLDLARSSVFSFGAKMRLLKEPLVRSRSAAAESVAAFFERRLGREIVDNAVDPFISGIFAGDPERLSIEHAFPRIFELERGHTSLLVGALLSRRGAKRPKGITRTISFAGGMQTLTDGLAEELGECLRLNTAVRSIVPRSPGFEVTTADGAAEFFDAVVIGAPAWAAADLLRENGPHLAETLSEIYYPPVAVVFTGFKKSSVKASPDGFGFLVPGTEKMNILGSLWTSSVFENRAPEGYHLFTTFIGGARNAELAALGENELADMAAADLDAVMGLSGPPEFASVKKWERAIPQYNIGYDKVVKAIENFESENRGIFFCSNFYKGISVGDCVKNSIATTRAVTDLLHGPAR